MSKERYDWIMAYKFESDYPSEQSWKLAFQKFINDLTEFDKRRRDVSGNS